KEVVDWSPSPQSLSSLQATGTKPANTHGPPSDRHTSPAVSKFEVHVEIVTLVRLADVFAKVYQTEFPLSVQVEAGSPVSSVAPLVSTVWVKGQEVTAIAFAQLSLAGAAPEGRRGAPTRGSFGFLSCLPSSWGLACVVRIEMRERSGR